MKTDWKKRIHDAIKNEVDGYFDSEPLVDVIESLLSEQEEEWKQNGGLQLRGTERGILAHLLEEHIESGSYFGRKDQHYKMCKELMPKLVAEKK